MNALEIAAAVRSGQRSARSVVDDCLSAVADRESDIHAFNLVTAAQARARADEIDAQVTAAGQCQREAGVLGMGSHIQSPRAGRGQRKYRIAGISQSHVYRRPVVDPPGKETE